MLSIGLAFTVNHHLEAMNNKPPKKTPSSLRSVSMTEFLFQKNTADRTSLQEAVISGNVADVNCLLSIAERQSQVDHDFDMFAYLMTHDADDNSALHLTAIHGRPEICRLIMSTAIGCGIKKQTLLSMENSRKQTALVIAAANAQEATTISSIKTNFATILQAYRYNATCRALSGLKPYYEE